MVKTASNLTDQELNAWAAKFFYGCLHKRIKEYSYDCFKGVCADCLQSVTDIAIEKVKNFNPVENLNHTHLMEEKIRKMGFNIFGEYPEDEWAENLKKILFGHHWDEPEYIDLYSFDLAHASARQRVEAAWLTFKRRNKNGR